MTTSPKSAVPINLDALATYRLVPAIPGLPTCNANSPDGIDVPIPTFRFPSGVIPVPPVPTASKRLSLARLINCDPSPAYASEKIVP